jgi:uncharacterized coiled-coil DUF342 family protein
MSLQQIVAAAVDMLAKGGNDEAADKATRKILSLKRKAEELRSEAGGLHGRRMSLVEGSGKLQNEIDDTRRRARDPNAADTPHVRMLKIELAEVKAQIASSVAGRPRKALRLPTSRKSLRSAVRHYAVNRSRISAASLILV